MDESDQRSVDPLESELVGFAPVAISPALVRKIGEELSRQRCSHARRKRIGFTLAGLTAAAACAVVAVMPWHDAPTPKPVAVVTRSQSIHSEAAPSWANYQQAFDRSPESFEAILDRDSRRLLRGGAELHPTITGDQL